MFVLKDKMAVEEVWVDKELPRVFLPIKHAMKDITLDAYTEYNAFMCLYVIHICFFWSVCATCVCKTQLNFKRQKKENTTTRRSK